MRRALSLLILAAAAAGCAQLSLLRPLPRACPGPLLPVSEMGADFSAQARYRVRSRGREEALTLVAEKRGGRLVLLGLDPLGTLVFSLVQEDREVRRERHLRPLFPFAPENALRDFERVRFAERLAGGEDDARVEARAGASLISREACGWEAMLAPIRSGGD